MRFSVALSISPEELERIDRARGNRTRSQFIREAVERLIDKGSRGRG